VHDGLSGVLVDSPEEFRAAISVLLQETALRKRLAAGAAATAGKFTWVATVRAFDRILTGKPASIAADRPLKI
jgi:glycosyltransferase involved in cell wall biosynthesis